MRYQWQNRKNPAWDYPEVYSMVTSHYDQIQVETNRSLGQVRLEVKTLRGEHYESILRQGVVLREKDLRTGALIDLGDILSIYAKEVSSLPDTPILSLIGGNYGILTEFLGHAERITVSDKSFLKRLLGLPKTILQAVLRWLKGTRSQWGYYRRHIRFADIFDMGLIAALTYGVFTYNFDYLSAGATLLGTALFTGLVDWMIRKREPWLLKVYASMGVALFALYRGYFFQ